MLNFFSLICFYSYELRGFAGGASGKEHAGDTRDVSSIPGLGRCPGGEQDNLLQYSCLENPMDRGYSP